MTATSRAGAAALALLATGAFLVALTAEAEAVTPARPGEFAYRHVVLDPSQIEYRPSIGEAMTKPRPIAQIIRIEPNPTYPGAVCLTVRCPHCGREHYHGDQAIKPDGNYGHRGAHCVTRFDRHGRDLPPWPGQDRGYIIRDVRNNR